MRRIPGKPGDSRLYAWVHYALFGGVLCSLVLLLLGLVLWGIGGAEGSLFPASLEQMLPQVLELKPAGILLLGILVLLATPLLRVIMALAAFWTSGDRRYALFSLAVLILLLFSVTLAAIL